MTLTADKEVVARRLTELTERLTNDICFDECTIKGLSCSVGCCIARRGDSFESVYKRADEALYKAKTGGKKQFVIDD
jgi:diguanylate cyclase